MQSHKTHRRSHPASSQEGKNGLPYRHVPTPHTRPQRSPRPMPSTPPHMWPSVVAKTIQTAHEQQTVKLRHPVCQPIKTVMLRRWQVLERLTATQIMLIQLKTCPQSQPKYRTSQNISYNWRKYTILQRVSSSKLHNQQLFSPVLTSSYFQSSTMPRPTHQKTSKTMAPFRRSSPSHIRRTHPWKTHWCPQPRLRCAHVSRSATPPFNHKRETSHTSAYLAPATWCMESTMIRCTIIQETTWME